MTDESKALEKERFEHHQEMLERFTEHLSEKSELPLAEMDRTDVVNQVSLYCAIHTCGVIIVYCGG
jgi:hypothetical protein